MKRILISIALIACLISGYAHADTYTYIGTNFEFTGGDDYTTDMRVTGSFTTSIPIPPNVSNFDLSGILTSWSFNDGVQTITNVNGVIPAPPQSDVSTDASGNIIVTNLRFWLSPIATVVGEVSSYIDIYVPGENFVDVRGVKEEVCMSIIGEGVCAIRIDSYGISQHGGVWTMTAELVFVDGFESLP